jgi:hypothetical protein
MKLDTESKMNFDSSVTTEDRFALRNWFQGFIDNLNNHNEAEIKSALSDALMVEGFSDIPMQAEEYVLFLKGLITKQANSVARFPKVSIKFQGYLFAIVGDFEVYIDNVLSYEGGVEITVVKNEQGFFMVRQKFFPRLMVHAEQ